MSGGSRFHESQRFHGGLLAVLIAALLLAVVLSLIALVSSRSTEPWTVAIAPVLVGVITVLLTLSHLDVDVTEDAVTIAFRYLWPARRIAFEEIVGIEVKRYRPLVDYGGWGVRLGPAGWAYSTGGDEGVKLRLRRGIPVLIGSR